MYIILSILAFSILIIIHELGHFMLAKLNGIKVEQFSLGMGPKLLGVKVGETEYLIKALPIGGYVKMLGDEGQSTDERAFFNKKPLQKLSVVLAGPIMNIILGVILFAIVGSLRGFTLPVVDKTIDGYPAQVAGIKQGDKIIKINDKKISTWEDFSIELGASKGKPAKLTFIRDNKEKEIVLTPKFDETDKKYMVGIAPTVVTNPSIPQSLKFGVDESKSLVKVTFKFFKDLFRGKVSKDDVGGPISVIRVTGVAAKAGVIQLMFLGGLISVQLGIMNLIPFPALDGGYIIMFLFELISGKKLDENKIGFINYIGFAMLMALMVLVTIKDILYPIKF